MVMTRYVSELVYIHTKLMIVDDRKVIVGRFAFFPWSPTANVLFADGFREFEWQESEGMYPSFSYHLVLTHIRALVTLK